jgi:hypothetical protein
MRPKKFSLAAVFIIILAVFYFNTINMPHKMFAYDNWGFYMYLPNLIIEGEFAPKNIDFLKAVNEKYELTPTYYQLSKTKDGVFVNRFFIGMSILLLPFFLVGHLIAQFTNYPADGYSAPYFYAVWLAAPVYFSMSIILIRKTLLKFFSDSIVALTLLTLYFVSNLFFFSSFGSLSPHILVFTEYSFLIWFTIKWHEGHKAKYARLIGLTIGLMAISRMSEIISLFIPLLWGVYNKETLFNKLKLIAAYKKQFYQLIFFAFLGGLPQILYWYASTGSIFFNSYNDPGSQLNLSNPRFLHVLFSYRKGWLLYSPIMILSIVGFIELYRQKKEIFWSIFVVFFINLYLIASFTSLNSYGYRAFIQSYAFMVIPLGYSFHYLARKLPLAVKIVFSLMLIVLAYVNYFQSYQILYNTLHGSRVTKEYYWAVFMKKFPSEDDKKLLLIERSNTNEDFPFAEEDYLNKIDAFEGFEREKNKVQHDTLIVYEGHYSYRMDENIVFGPSMSLSYKEVTDDYYAYFRPSVYVYPAYDVSEKDVFVVFHFEIDGKPNKYRAYNLNDSRFGVEKDKWNKITFDYLSPEIVSNKDLIKFYIWNRDKQKLYIDNMQIESFTRNLNN